MSSAVKHEARSHKTHQTPMHKSNVVFRQKGLIPKHSEQNKNRCHWPSLEDRFGSFKTSGELEQKILKKYEKESAK